MTTSILFAAYSGCLISHTPTNVDFLGNKDGLQFRDIRGADFFAMGHPVGQWRDFERTGPDGQRRRFASHVFTIDSQAHAGKSYRLIVPAEVGREEPHFTPLVSNRSYLLVGELPSDGQIWFPFTGNPLQFPRTKLATNAEVGELAGWLALPIAGGASTQSADKARRLVELISTGLEGLTEHELRRNRDYLGSLRFDKLITEDANDLSWLRGAGSEMILQLSKGLPPYERSWFLGLLVQWHVAKGRETFVDLLDRISSSAIVYSDPKDEAFLWQCYLTSWPSDKDPDLARRQGRQLIDVALKAKSPSLATYALRESVEVPFDDQKKALALLDNPDRNVRLALLDKLAHWQKLPSLASGAVPFTVEKEQELIQFWKARGVKPTGQDG